VITDHCSLIHSRLKFLNRKNLNLEISFSYQFSQECDLYSMHTLNIKIDYKSVF